MSKKHYISWIVAAVAMFVISCIWHGAILNDFERLMIPLNVYLTIASLVYLVIGWIVMLLFYFLDFRMNAYKKGVFFGAMVGLFIYLTIFVLNVAYSPEFQLTHVIFDLEWQIAEQSVGGLSCAGVCAYFRWQARLLPQ